MPAFMVNGLTAAPMTAVWASGFEMGEPANDGLASVSGTPVYSTTEYNKSLASRKVIDGGGVDPNPGRAIQFEGSAQTNLFRASLRELVIGFYFLRPQVINACSIRLADATLTTRFTIIGTSSSLNSAWRVFQGAPNSAASNYLATAPVDLLVGQYYFGHVFMDPTVGFFRGYLDDFRQASRVMTFSGNTSGAADPYIAAVLFIGSVGRNMLIDDLVVYARTLFIENVAGPLIFRGQSITDTVSGATAVVDAVEFDRLDPTKAVVYMSDVLGDFGAGNPLSFQAGGTAQAVNAHPEDIHGLVHRVYIRRQKMVTTIQSNWTRNGGASDHEAISDLPIADNGLYLEATSAGLVNEHGVDNAVAGLYGGADFAYVQAFATQDGTGTVASLDLGVNSGSATATDGPLPVSATPGLIVGPVVMRNPDTGDYWKIAETDAVTVTLESAP